MSDHHNLTAVERDRLIERLEQDLLDGYDVTELVALCRRLADECDRRTAGQG